MGVIPVVFPYINQGQNNEPRGDTADRDPKELANRATPTDKQVNQRRNEQQKVDSRDSNLKKCRKQGVNNVGKKGGVDVTWDRKASAAHTETSQEKQRSKPVLGWARKALLSQKRTLRVEEVKALENKKYRKGLSIKAAVLL